jgi:acyl-CoA synthetase (NDP forming)
MLAEPTLRRDLSALFSPASVAVVGASDDPVKWGHWLAVRALRGGQRRTIHLVNRRGGHVLGQPAYPSLADVPGGAELVVLVVPSAHLEQGVRDAIGAGARAIVAITAGNDGEAGGAGDAALAALAREAGVALLGPNCLGVFDAGADLELVSNDFPQGSIGLISQSGALALELAMLCTEAGVGFSRFVSLGNQADLEAADFVRDFAAHEETALIALYAEDFRDGRQFIAAAHAAAEAGKPVVLLPIEHTEATARAVRSHTGALASDRATIDAACRAAGIERVDSPQELVDLAQALLAAPPAAGSRVAVLADGGGHGGIAAGLAAAAGLDVPELSPAVTARLRAALPPTAAVSNPIDLAGGGEQDIHSFDRTSAALLDSGEVDGVLLSGYFGGYNGYGLEMAARELAVADAMAASVARSGRPLVVHSMHPDQPAALRLRASGVPVYKTIDRAVAVLSRLTARAGRSLGALPELPAPATPIAGHDYDAARALLAAGGVPFAAARTVQSAGEAVAAAAEVGYPVVLKALGLLHKSDAGGVVLGIGDEAALRAAVADLQARLSPAGLSVERMAPLADGVELIVGARWDARFGPMVLVGLGGIFAETLRDTAVALAPVGAAEAERLLRGLRGAPLLEGVRGRPPVDVAAAAEAVAALSRVAAAHPEIAEIEVNPLLVTPTGALGLDARIVPAR